jgi:hypothetical protein
MQNDCLRILDLYPPGRIHSETKRQGVRFLILSGVPHKEDVRLSEVLRGTVSGIRQELRASTPLYQNTETGFGVPNKRKPVRFG